MRTMFNSQERTLREMVALALTGGWKVVDSVLEEGSLFGHITAVPVEIPEESLALIEPPKVAVEAKSTGMQILL